AFEAVARDEAVAAFLWFPLAVWLARGRADLKVVAVSDEGLAFPIGAGVRKRDPGLAEAIDAAVERLLASDRAQELLARYGIVSATRTSRESPFVLVQDKDRGE